MEAVDKMTIIQLFRQLSQTEQLDVYKQISKQTFTQRWNLMDEELPDSDISSEEIMKEVRAVRYGNKKD